MGDFVTALRDLPPVGGHTGLTAIVDALLDLREAVTTPREVTGGQMLVMPFGDSLPPAENYKYAIAIAAPDPEIREYVYISARRWIQDPPGWVWEWMRLQA